jgi:hypothetical protein
MKYKTHWKYLYYHSKGWICYPGEFIVGKAASGNRRGQMQLYKF